MTPTMKGATERFYDLFSRQIVRDYIWGNRRVDRQLEYLSAAVPQSTSSVLIIGCGAGEAARAIAARIAPRSHVLAVDISLQILRLAQAINSHPRVTYQRLDVTAEAPHGKFDVIVLPDVYEHIPVAAREIVHDRLDALLTDHGRLLLTIPSPAKQTALAAAGQGLQIVDETVTIEDLMALARAVRGQLTYLNVISVWNTNDYVHVAISRSANAIQPLNAATRLPLQTGSKENVLARLNRKSKLGTLPRLVRAGFRYLRLQVRAQGAGNVLTSGPTDEP